MEDWLQRPGHKLDSLQQLALTMMSGLVLLTFVATNAQALFWQSSDWLVGTVLPAVVVNLTNEERGVAQPLVRSATLDAAATAKAEHMARNGYFAHFAPDGTTPWHFFKEAGYTYAHAGENLAIHFSDSAEVVDAWMESQEHKANIINPDFQEIGVGTARGTFDGYETTFVVQLFGTPAVVPEVTIQTDETDRDGSIETRSTVNDNDTAYQLDHTTTLADLRAAARQLELRVAEQVARADVSTPTDRDGTAVFSVTPNPVVDDSGTISNPDQAEPTQVIPSTITNQMEVSPAPKQPSTEPSYVVRTQLSTSSGLAVAQVYEGTDSLTRQHSAGSSLAAIATRPSLVLQTMYTLVAVSLMGILGAALWREIHRHQYVQVAYSLALCVLMGGLWYIHSLLTHGAVIV